MSKTIKEIYNEEFIDKPDTSLLKHYNSVLNKTPDELNVDDICMLVRQEFFLEISVPKAIEILKRDHSAGDNYDYSLLVNLSNVESSLSKYKGIICDLINVLWLQIHYVWIGKWRTRLFRVYWTIKGKN